MFFKFGPQDGRIAGEFVTEFYTGVAGFGGANEAGFEGNISTDVLHVVVAPRNGVYSD